MKDMFQDPFGKTSETRVLRFVVTVIFMVTWAALSIQRGYMVPISGSIVAIFGIISGQKGIQSFAEHKGNKNE